jgi:hypothetical protein
MHLHERIAQRITEMCNAGQVSPEAVRCLLSEFSSATLRDWGAAHVLCRSRPNR